MLVNLPYLTHALFSIYEWNAIIHKKGESEGKFSPHGGGYGGGLIGPSISTQSRYCGIS